MEFPFNHIPNSKVKGRALPWELKIRVLNTAILGSVPGSIAMLMSLPTHSGSTESKEWDCPGGAALSSEGENSAPFRAPPTLLLPPGHLTESASS